jgi:hypothetical protein
MSLLENCYSVELHRLVGRLVCQRALVLVYAENPPHAREKATELALSPVGGVHWDSSQPVETEWVEEAACDEEWLPIPAGPLKASLLSTLAHARVLRAVERHVGSSLGDAEKERLVTALLGLAELEAHQAVAAAVVTRGKRTGGRAAAAVRSVLRPLAALTSWLAARRGNRARNAVFALTLALGRAKCIRSSGPDPELRTRAAECLRLMLGREPRDDEVELAASYIPF